MTTTTSKNTPGSKSKGPKDRRPVLTRVNRLKALRTAYSDDPALTSWSAVRSSMLSGEGQSESPRIAFVVLAPERHDVQETRSFLSGRESVVFRDMLNTVDMPRHQVYITALCKWSASQHRIWESPLAMDTALAYLGQELDLVQPKNVVLLGRPISELLLPGVNLVRDHGQVAEGHYRSYIPMFHPMSALLNNDIARALMKDMASIHHLL